MQTKTKRADGEFRGAAKFIVLCASMLPSAVLAQPDTACFDHAASRYQIHPAILKSISRVESGGNPAAINRNANGSSDIGHMQINSAWLPTLAKYGIGAKELANPCTNTHVGAWILANNFRRMGYGWDAIGAYNAKSPIRRAVYTRKVALAMGKEIE